MMKKLLTTITLLTLIPIVYAQQVQTASSDPMQAILDKLITIEKRLEALEKAPSPSSIDDKTTTSTQTSNAIKKYKKGFVVQIKSQENKSVLSKYIEKKLSYETKDVRSNITLTSEPIAYSLEIQAYLQIKEQGEYSFGILTKSPGTIPVNCDVSISLDGNSILSQQVELSIMSSMEFIAVDTIELEAGIYQYELMSSCDDTEGQKVTRSHLIKTPKDSGLRVMQEGELLYESET